MQFNQTWEALNRFPHFKYIYTGVLLFSLMFIAFYIRVQGVERIPEGQFTGNDAYLYYLRAQTIEEQGILPPRDMHRWLPLGRDNGQTLAFYSYVLAYTHKVFPWVSLYHIQLYAPVVCFTLGLGVLFLFFVRYYSTVFASIVTLLLATLPGSISRSAAGFGDRDAWCWLLGILAVTSYLSKERMQPGKLRWLTTIFSGICCFLGGLSWEAFGLFVLILLVSELWKFCTTVAEHHLNEFLLWVLMFVPWLYLVSPAYRSGYGLAAHVDVLMLFSPLIIFAIRGLRFLLLHFYETLRPHGREIACWLTVLCITVGIGYTFAQSETFESTTLMFQKSRLMQNVSELADPDFGYWRWRYGAIFILGSLGLIAASLQLWKQSAFPLVLALTLFTATTFFRENLDTQIGSNTCNTLFLISLALIPITSILLYKGTAHSKLVTITAIVWFVLWVGLARGGKRYDFFIGMPLAYGTAWLLWRFPAYLMQRLKSAKILYPNIRNRYVTATLAIVVLIPVLFWSPVGGHATRSIRSAKMKSPKPGRGNLAQAFEWVKTTLPQDAVVAANWGYGSQLNVLGGVKTITGPDIFLPHWIHLYYRHVFCAQDEVEALSFLKTHKVTHLMLAEWELFSRARDYSFIGSNENNDRFFGLHKLEREETPIGRPYRMIPQMRNVPLTYIDIIRASPESLSITARFRDEKEIKITLDKSDKSTNPMKVDLGNGGLLLYFDINVELQKAYYLSSIGWNSFAVKCFLRQEQSTAFVPIYPNETSPSTKVKIWEIHYPPNIQTDDKYLVITPGGTPKDK